MHYNQYDPGANKQYRRCGTPKDLPAPGHFVCRGWHEVAGKIGKQASDNQQRAPLP